MENESNAIRCPIELAMEQINRKWVIQIIRDMFFGKKRFNEFKEGKPQLSNKVLSNCLKEMEENGLIQRKEDDGNIEYKLTEKGEALNRVLYELAIFTLNTDYNNENYTDETKEELREVFRKTLL